MKRVYFFRKEERDDFFNKIKASKKSWQKIGNFLGTNRTMIENYRRGKLCIPLDRFSKLIDLMSFDEKDYFANKIGYKESNWGQIIGGLKAYKIKKQSFDKGRRKGIISRKNFGVKYDFNINLPLSHGLCEFIGAVIGDGFTNKYGHMYQTQITGDKNLDEEYYQKVLSPICEKEFNIKPIIKKRWDRITLTLYSKRIFELLTNRFGIPRGIKCYTVVIPDEIFRAENKFLKSVLKGMFDTDGGIGLDKRKAYKKPYIRINYTSVSEKLAKQIDGFLSQIAIPHSLHKQGNAFKIQINGQQNVKKFVSEIGFSNPRHLRRVSALL